MPREETPQIQRLGRFTLLKRLAAGGMAEIYLARHAAIEGFRKPLVIKRIHQHLSIDPRFVNMFLDEARIATSLNHPCIVQIFELGRVGDYPFIAMEYIEGASLRELGRLAASKKKPMPWTIAAWIGARICEGLDHAHNLVDENGNSVNLVHRDVSPQNLLVSYDGGVKLVDFGIARANNRLEETQSYSRKGKLRYMSPEQALGLDLDHRSDLFSLGIVLWELTSNRKLFDSAGELGVLRQITEAPIPDPVTPLGPLPQAYLAVLRRALEREPDDRFATAAQMGAALDAALVTAPGDQISNPQISNPQISNPAHPAPPNARQVSDYVRDLLGDQVERQRQDVKRLMALDLSGIETPADEQTDAGVTPAARGRRAVLALAVFGAAFGVAVALVSPMITGGQPTAGDGAATAVDVDASAPAPVRDEAPTPIHDAPPASLPTPTPVAQTPKPAPATAPVVASASLSVTSTPSGATVTLNGRRLSGSTPLASIEVKPGVHTLTFAKSGYRKESRRVTTNAGAKQTLHAKLRALPPPPGYLTFNTVPWSEVYLGKKRLGQTTPLVKLKLPAGRHQLRILPEGKGPAREVEVLIKSGQLTRKSLRL